MDTPAHQNQNPQTENIPLWKQPHIPVTQQDMTGLNPVNGGGRNYTLLTLASLLVLAGVIGITLFLYIQNHQQNIQHTLNSTKASPTIQNKKKETQPMAKSQLNHNLENIPNDLFSHNETTSLWLPNNHITSIPADIKNLKNLETINLVSNQLTTLPDEIGTLTNLKVLLLSDNKIVTLPKSISQLKQLQRLTLDGNYLSNTEIENIKENLPNTNISFGIQNILPQNTRPLSK